MSNAKNKINKKSDTSIKNNQLIYFDNNSTTLMCQPAIKIYNEWLNVYNPSSDSKVSRKVKSMIQNSSDYILDHCGVNSSTHTIVFTSGATESNCLIIRSCVKAYRKKLLENNIDKLPHIIASATEHHSIIECLKDLVESKFIEVSYVIPTIYGNIKASDVEAFILPTTCLITVMFANNEIPIINNIKEIGQVAHKHKIPMHSDCVQIFGKYRINVMQNNIDALSASAHKFYGPKGAGILIINNELLEGYNITGEINGSQQKGLRGGTENPAAIASTVLALKNTFKKRKEKNEHLFKLRNALLDKLSLNLPFGNYIDYINESKKEKKDIELLSLGVSNDKQAFILPNTVLLSICKNTGKPFCNVELKKYLDSKNVIVSIGSACLTSSDKASHVLTAIGANSVVKRGVIRISFNDNNTIEEVNKFVNILIAGIEKQR